MMTTRQPALYAMLLGGLVLGALAGCSAGNPNMSAAETAMEQENYERALANVDSALTQDSANTDAYMMKANILRQMADSTVPADRYKELYEKARAAEEKAIEFDPSLRSQVKSQRRLAYIQEFRKGAQQFNRAQSAGTEQAYMRAAALFGAAGAIQPDSTGPILNEAFARLSAAQVGGGDEMASKMKKVIPILERYHELEDKPSKESYTILAQLYLQNDRPEEVVELTKKAIEDLSNRPTHFRVGGARGLQYTGTVEEDGNSRSVEGTVPDRITLSTDEGTVSGHFQKNQPKGTLQVSLWKHGVRAASDRITSESDTASITYDLSETNAIAELQNYRLNALDRTGNTKEAMRIYRQQIESHPENATYRYNYGSLLLRADRYDEAVEQLGRAAELDPDDPKKQYNYGAAYLNKGVVLQDSLVALRDSVLSENRQPTQKEEDMIRELDRQRRELFMKAIPPLERARQLSGRSGEYLKQTCTALFQAYVQTEQEEKAKQVQECASQSAGTDTTQQGSGGDGGL